MLVSQLLILTGIAFVNAEVSTLTSRDLASHHTKRTIGGGLGDWLGDFFGFHKTYNISFYHINDVHAHLDQFRSSGSSCTDPGRGCVGGYARVKTVIDSTRKTHKNSLFLNAGDEFQGTLFYTLYKGWKIAETLNQLGFDAMTLGNHEFDDGDDLLADFLGNLTFPAISSNIETTNKKLAKRLVPYKLFLKHSLALVAVTTDTTPGISNPGNGTTFAPPIAAVQKTVNSIRRRHPYIKRIVALTHIGYDQDLLLAQQTTGVNLIIGGHSHTLLSDDPGAKGKYPTIAKNKAGEEVFVVTAHRWGERLGYIDIAYAPYSGKILGYTGAAIHLTNATVQEPKLQGQVKEWSGAFAEFSGKILGVTASTLVQTTCQTQECTLGDFSADAIMAYRPQADIAILNAGGIRAEVDAGNVTLQHALECFPFGNSIAEVSMTGEELWKVFEGIVSKVSVFNGQPVTSGVQVSAGLRFTYNPTNPVGSRLISLTVGGANVVLDKSYAVATLDFLASGGDNFWLPKTGWVPLKGMDEVWSEQVTAQSPLDVKLDGRIATTTETVPQVTL